MSTVTTPTPAIPAPRLYKNMRGHWTADTLEIALPAFADTIVRVLDISTSKRSDGSITTSATVNVIKGTMKSHAMFGDFSHIIEREVVRCTGQSVQAQHARAVAKVPAIIEAVIGYYVQKGCKLAE